MGQFARPGLECLPPPVWLRKVLDQDADDRVPQCPYDDGFAENRGIGAEITQPSREGLLERVGGLEQGLEHVVVAVDGLREQRSPEVFVHGHADEQVVEQCAEALLDRAPDALGKWRSGQVRGPPVRDCSLQQVVFRRVVVVQRRDVQAAGAGNGSHAGPARPAASHETKRCIEDSIPLISHAVNTLSNVRLGAFAQHESYGGTMPETGAEAEFLANYDATKYAPVAVTVDVVLLTVRAGRLAVLLVERKGHPFQGQWALPGGFVEPEDDLDGAAQRELKEETGVLIAGEVAGVHLGHLEQLRSYGTPGRDPRMRVVSVAYVGFTARDEAIAGSDAADARFWAVDDLAISGIGSEDGVVLAFDHDRIVADGVERARAKLEYTTLATAFLDEPFTLGELRRVYEAVWGESLHEGNFRRKVLSTPGFVESTGETAPTVGRPAALYRRGGATRLHPAI